jgi:hypothetical protein
VTDLRRLLVIQEFVDRHGRALTGGDCIDGKIRARNNIAAGKNPFDVRS